MRRRFWAAVAAGLAVVGSVDAQAPATYLESAPSEAASKALGDGTAPGRTVWATGEYLVWFTRNQKSPVLAASVPTGSAIAGAVPPGTVTTALFPTNGKQVEFDAQNGVRGRVGSTFGTVFGFDVGGFVLERQDAGFSAASPGVPSLALPYTRAGGGDQFLFVALPGQFGGDVSVTADTKLWGIDGNARIEWYRLFVDRSELLVGFRYANLKEGIEISDRANLPGGIVSAIRDSFRTENQFYGAQAGFHARLFGYRGASLEVIDTFGLGGMEQKVTIAGSNTLTGRTAQATGFYAQGTNIGTYSRTKFAAVNEGTVNLGYEFTPHIRAHVGYSIFWMSSVVRPGSTIDTTVNDSNIRYVPNPPADTTNARPSFNFNRTATDFWAQGLTLGLTVEF